MVRFPGQLSLVKMLLVRLFSPFRNVVHLRFFELHFAEGRAISVENVLLGIALDHVLYDLLAFSLSNDIEILGRPLFRLISGVLHFSQVFLHVRVGIPHFFELLN